MLTVKDLKAVRLFAFELQDVFQIEPFSRAVLVESAFVVSCSMAGQQDLAARRVIHINDGTVVTVRLLHRI